MKFVLLLRFSVAYFGLSLSCRLLVFSGDVRRARVIPWLVRHSAAIGS